MSEKRQSKVLKRFYCLARITKKLTVLLIIEELTQNKVHRKAFLSAYPLICNMLRYHVRHGNDVMKYVKKYLIKYAQLLRHSLHCYNVNNKLIRWRNFTSFTCKKIIQIEAVLRKIHSFFVSAVDMQHLYSVFQLEQQDLSSNIA